MAEPSAPPPSSHGAGPGSSDKAKGPSDGSDLNDPGGLSTDKPTLSLGYRGPNVHDTPAGLLGGVASPSSLSPAGPPCRQKKSLKSNGDTTFSDKIQKTGLLSAGFLGRTEKYSPGFACRESSLFKP